MERVVLGNLYKRQQELIQKAKDNQLMLDRKKIYEEVKNIYIKKKFIRKSNFLKII